MAAGDGGTRRKFPDSLRAPTAGKPRGTRQPSPSAATHLVAPSSPSLLPTSTSSSPRITPVPPSETPEVAKTRDPSRNQALHAKKTLPQAQKDVAKVVAHAAQPSSSAGSSFRAAQPSSSAGSSAKAAQPSLSSTRITGDVKNATPTRSSIPPRTSAIPTSLSSSSSKKANGSTETRKDKQPVTANLDNIDPRNTGPPTPTPPPQNIPVKPASISEALWNTAYTALKEEYGDLAAVLEQEYILRSSKVDARVDANQFVTSITSRLEERDTRQWILKIAGKKIKIREQAEKVLRFIIWSKDFVATAVQAEPHAALAWAGISLLLPLLLGDVEQNDAMMAGLAFISDILPLYRVREDVYLAEESDNPELYNRIVVLYKTILLYQACGIAFLKKKTVIQTFRNIIQKDSWKTWQDSIENAHKRCEALIGVIGERNETDHWKQLFAHLRGTTSLNTELLNAFERYRDEQRRARADSQIERCLQTLSSNYEDVKDIIPKRITGTCEWFVDVKNSRFRRWRESQTSSLLWISADPGWGKSVLSRYLIDHRLMTVNVTTSAVGYFFFRDGLDGKTQASDALSALLHNILTATPDIEVANHAVPSFFNHGERLKGMFAELWRILLKVAEDPRLGEIVCVIDALDECEPTSRDMLIEKLVELYSDTSLVRKDNFRLKFFVTSRPCPEIEARFKSLQTAVSFIHLDGNEEFENIGRDVNQFIDVRIPQIASELSQSIQKEIITRLKRFEHRTYLWLYLMTENIKENLDQYSTKQRAALMIDQLPKSVHTAYAAILNKSSNHDRAVLVLQIVVGARRPLTVQEMNVALELACLDGHEQCNSYEALDLPEENLFHSTVKRYCGHFIVIRDSRLYLMHQTAREFLLAETASPEQIWYQFSSEQAQTMMAQITLRHLQFDIFKDGSQFESVVEGKTGVTQRVMKADCHPLFSYTGLYWTEHVKWLKRDVFPELVLEASDICNPLSPIFDTWMGILTSQLQYSYMIQERTNITALILASHFGLDSVVEELVDSGADVNSSVHGWLATALIGAATSESSHVSTVALLHGMGARIDATNSSGRTALMLACQNHLTPITKLLIELGADLDFCVGDQRGTALTAACIGDDETAAELLLENEALCNADINVHWHHGSPLQIAAARGNRPLLETLLRFEADVDTCSGHYHTALQAAAASGHKEIVCRLLQKGANVDLRGGEYGSSLNAAVSNGYEEIVEVLLAHGADPAGDRGPKGRPIHYAARYGHLNILDILLHRGVNIDDVDTYSGTPLQQAAERGHVEIVRFLLDREANIDLGPSSTVFPLREASAKGHAAVVDLLLSRGAALGSHSNDLFSAIHLAFRHDHRDAMKILLRVMIDRWASSSGEKMMLGEPLVAACKYNFIDEARQMLERGADPNGNDHIGHVKLSRTHLDLLPDSNSGQRTHNLLEELELLVERDVNVFNKLLSPPLVVAVLNNYVEMTILLLDFDADIEGAHEDYVETISESLAPAWEESWNFANLKMLSISPLMVATSKSHVELVELLLLRGANANGLRKYSGTPLLKIAEMPPTMESRKIAMCLLNHRADVNKQEEFGETPLIIAAMKENELMVQLLLEHGAEVSVDLGWGGFLMRFKQLMKFPQIVELLLDKGANVNGQNFDQRPIFLSKSDFRETPLYIAANWGLRETVELFLRRGAAIPLEIHSDECGFRPGDSFIPGLTGLVTRIIDYAHMLPLSMEDVYNVADLLANRSKQNISTSNR